MVMTKGHQILNGITKETHFKLIWLGRAQQRAQQVTDRHDKIEDIKCKLKYRNILLG